VLCRRIAVHSLLLILVGCLHSNLTTALPAQEPQLDRRTPNDFQLQLIPSPRQHPPRSPVNLQVDVSGTERANLCPYVRAMLASINRRLLSSLPESASRGQEGTVLLRVQMQRDGSVPQDGITIASTSGTGDMDVAAQEAIRNAAPFGHLPEGYARSELLLLFRVSYVYVPSNTPRQTYSSRTV
jgi:TonB family protein